MKNITLTLTAITLTAIAFTSCASNPPPQATATAAAAPADGFSEVSNMSDDLIRKCQSDYKEDFCGVGEGMSTKSGSAGDIASANASRNLAQQVEMDIKATLANSYSVDPNDQDVSSTLNQIVQKVQGTFNNITVRDSKTQFNQQEGKYRVYRIVSVPKNDVYKSMKNAMSADQAMQSTATAVVITEMINKELEKIAQ